MRSRVLNVAEKPAMAKSIASILSKGNMNRVIIQKLLNIREQELTNIAVCMILNILGLRGLLWI